MNYTKQNTIKGRKQIMSFKINNDQTGKVHTYEVKDRANQIYYGKSFMRLGSSIYGKPELCDVHINIDLTKCTDFTTFKTTEGKVLFWRDIDKLSINITHYDNVDIDVRTVDFSHAE